MLGHQTQLVVQPLARLLVTVLALLCIVAGGRSSQSLLVAAFTSPSTSRYSDARTHSAKGMRLRLIHHRNWSTLISTLRSSSQSTQATRAASSTAHSAFASQSTTHAFADRFHDITRNGSIRRSFLSFPTSSSLAFGQSSSQLQSQSQSTAQSRDQSGSTKQYKMPPIPKDDVDNEGNAENVVTPYEHWVRRLYMTNMFHPVKLGLENMNQLHEKIGSPMSNPNVTIIHIAGTNGKGSVALKLANTLQKNNLKVGLFCSPHVSSFRERMQVNSKLISEQQVVELLPKIYQACEDHDLPATFFEVTTALAFMFYAQEEVDVVVLETGLGGRLDATNIVQDPAMSIITSIGLEHTRILGDTIELIAVEKGGIIKPGRPVLAGPNCPHAVLRQCAKDKNAGDYYITDDVLDDPPATVNDYDLENSRTVKAALKLLQKSHPRLVESLTPDDIEQGVAIRPPCRFEEVPRDDDVRVILDVAHNPPAMEYLVQKLKTTYPDDNYRFVVGMSSDKDLSQCAASVLSCTASSNVHLVEAAHPRAAKVQAILEASPELAQDGQYDLKDPSITKQVQAALELAKEKNELLVVCGSVFLMAEAREALGFDEPRDSEHISEMAGAGIRHSQENFGGSQAKTA